MGVMQAWRAEAAQVAWRDFLHGEALSWLFVAKSLAAALLALWLALRFALPQPYTAMLTVFIVMRPQSGLVLAKSFYRTIGTLAGAAATLLLYALVPQQRVPFLLGLALWVSLCTFGAARYRNFASYAFVLSGYTACIIGLPAVSAPGDIFEDAVARVSEVMLGILCAGTVGAVVFPQQLRDALVRTVRARFGKFAGYSHAALTGALDHARIEAHWRAFVTDAIGLEAQRSSTIFENPQTRMRSAMVQRLNLEFMSANTRLLRLHHWMHRLRLRRGEAGEAPCDEAAAVVVTAVETLYRPLADALAVELGAHTGEQARELAGALARFRAGLPAQATALRAGMDASAQVDFEVALGLLDDYAQELERYAATYATLRDAPVQAGAEPASRRHAFVPHTDTLVDLLVGLRAGLALLIGSAIWIWTAWPSGLGMVILGTVFVALYGSSPNPIASLRFLVTGFLIAAVCAVLCYSLVLPQLHDFATLAFALAPFLIVGNYMLTRPALASIGAGFNILFVDGINIRVSMDYDWAGLLNDVFADLSCVLLALVLLSVFMPAGGRWLRRRMLLGLRRYVVATCRAPLAGQHARFETAPRDLLQKLLSQPGLSAEATTRTVQWAQLVMNTGRGVLDLRARLAAAAPPPALRARIEHGALPRLARLFEHPHEATHRRALQSLASGERALTAWFTRADTGEAIATRRHLLAAVHLLRLQLEDAAAGLFRAAAE
ncbi:FUSC family protein [Rhodanobacter sp. Si-c]|uniref:FUSC family protein n=1 Tax=Rhodanobacter lycopersici TaxID=3162487 RepID=A0ABV3QDG3_9GAMM